MRRIESYDSVFENVISNQNEKDLEIESSQNSTSQKSLRRSASEGIQKNFLNKSIFSKSKKISANNFEDINLLEKNSNLDENEL